MRITKQIAAQVSELLLKEKKKLIESKYNELQELCTTEYEKQLPTDVLKCFKKHSAYFSTARTFYLDGHGLSREYSVTASRKLPNGSSYIVLELTPALASKILVLLNQWNDMKKAYDKLEVNLQEALFACRTYTNVEKNIPEAVKYLPAPRQEIIINFNDIRNSLK